MSGVHPPEPREEPSTAMNEALISTNAADAAEDSSAERAPSFGLWIMINMVTVLFCVAWPTGIPGFVIALLAQSDWAGGDTQGARRKYRLAVVLGSLSLVWGGLIALGLLTFFLFAAAIPGTAQPLAPPSY